MSPRPYRLGMRQAAITETRTRIVEAARDLLMASSGAAGFTMDAVARQANVARMTVYYQFGSKAGLLEALFDNLAERGGMQRLAAAFQKPSALDALDSFIGVFCHFWNSEHAVLKRLNALAALDSELSDALDQRSEWARQGLAVLVGRMAQDAGRPGKKEIGTTVDMLFALTSFGTFDTLAGRGRSAEQVARLIRRMARAVLESAP